jgi:hypothetical protein
MTFFVSCDLFFKYPHNDLQGENTMDKPGTHIPTTIAVLFLATATLSAGDALAEGQTLKQQIIGTWTLVSNDNVAANGSRRQIFGPHPKGILILDASGRMPRSR